MDTVSDIPNRDLPIADVFFFFFFTYYGPVILAFIKGNMNSQNDINTLDGHLNTSYGQNKTVETNNFIYR